MTSQRQPPVLDVLINRTVMETPVGPATTTFRFNRRAGPLDSIMAGEWTFGGTRITASLEDADGLGLPVPGSLTLDVSSVLTVASGNYSITLPFVDYTQATDPFNSPLNAARIDFTGALDSNLLPSQGGTADVFITLPLGGTPSPVTTTVQVWATRRDFLGRDFVTAVDSSLISISDSRFLVRNLGHPWEVGDTLTDEYGDVRTVRGVAHYPAGRGAFLEVLARRLGN